MPSPSIAAARIPVQSMTSVRRSVDIDLLSASSFNCYRTCFAMAYRLEEFKHGHQATLLRDCADLCRTLAELALRRNGRGTEPW